MTSQEDTIGIVGLGNMGGAMAARLKDLGEHLLGFDVDPGRATTIGINAADSVKQVGQTCDVILLSLPDSSVVETVMLGADGLVARLRPGQVVCDLSTSSPGSTRAIAKAVQDRGAGFVDGGVSGGPRGARGGTLTIMSGGSEGDLARVRPVLEGIAENIFHLGPSGSGHTAKVLNNFLNAVNLAATSEVFVAAQRAELDLHALLDAINKSSGVSNATLKRFPSILEGDYRDGNLSMALMMKDVRLYLDLARSLEVPTLMSSGCLAMFGTAISLGHEKAVNNRIVDVVGDLAGGIRVSGQGRRRGTEPGVGSGG